MQTKSTLAAPKMTFDTNEFYLRSSEEMAQAFAEWPEALASTLEIAERCDVEIELGRQLIPRFLPEGEDERAYLRERVMEGLRARYGDPPPARRGRAHGDGARGHRPDGLQRLLPDRLGLRQVGQGQRHRRRPRARHRGRLDRRLRLRITDVDPLRYDLLFERFLNPERVSMPDIDIDFSVRGRERVMQYVVDKYGRESVAQIITFGKMFPRAATRDAARVLGHDYGVGDRLAKLIPDPQQGRAADLRRLPAAGRAAARAPTTPTPTAKQIVDVARGLEGIVRNSSIHAAAVVIADLPLTDIVPLQLADSGRGQRTNGDGGERTTGSSRSSR